VQKRLGHLALQNDQLVEKFNQAQVAVGKRDAAAASARRSAQAAARHYAETRVGFVRMVQAQYEGQQSFGAASALLSSDSGSNYLDRLNTLNMVTRQTAQIVTIVTHSRNAAAASSKKANAALTAAKHERDALQAKRKSTQKQIDKYRSMLQTLTAAQRAAFQDNGQVSPGSLTHLTTATSAAARRAVDFALKQVGKPYVFGAAGPGSYDCSGLTMAAWGKAGVAMSHGSRDQYADFPKVSKSQLQPGDLVLFYSDMHHIGIYVGNGMVIHAGNPDSGVQYIPMNEMPAVGFVRP
jgi:cell wall-associated NlpC family hydrolase